MLLRNVKLYAVFLKCVRYFYKILPLDNRAATGHLSKTPFFAMAVIIHADLHTLSKTRPVEEKKIEQQTGR